jgi:hypothetical protein
VQVAAAQVLVAASHRSYELEHIDEPQVHGYEALSAELSVTVQVAAAQVFVLESHCSYDSEQIEDPQAQG